MRSQRDWKGADLESVAPSHKRGEADVCKHYATTYDYVEGEIIKRGQATTCERCGIRIVLGDYGDGIGDPIFVEVAR